MTESSRTAEHSVADVVIVGFGAAAMAAAITAHDAGADVVLLEKMPPATAGGNTRVSGSVWSSPADVDQAKVHLRALAQQFPVDEDIVAAWAQETSKITAWMRERLAEVAGKVERDPLDPYTGDGTDITKITCGEEMGGKWDPNIPEHEFPELEGNDCGTEWYYVGGRRGSPASGSR
jgi:glycine/D-amino acid oxidase-like deaminating enzyme